MALTLLRLIPEVGTLEWRVAQKGMWDEELIEWAHELAEHLFGISEYDIEEDEDEFFPVLRMMRDEADAYWKQHGWDVTDEEGKQLIVMDYLAKPLVCLVEKRHPDAQFKRSTEDWARQLEDDAKRFKPSR
jgi:hypothetical protein